MSIQPINIVYVDDRIDPILSRYLDEYCSRPSSAELLYTEEPFSKGDTYDILLNKESIQTANILLIDSRLFEEADAGNQFTGEEFRIILNKLFPYIEVIVISFNTLDIEWSVVSKCKEGRSYSDAKVYYDNKLRCVLEDKLKIIHENRRIIGRLENKNTIDRVLVEKIRRAAEGVIKYDELTASDINNVVRAFQELISKG